jgi:hypothetical protein
LWFIVVLVILAALIILFLCIPFDLVFRANMEGQHKFSIRLIWLFGLFSTELGRTRRKPTEHRAVEYQKKPSDWMQKLKLSLDILQTKGLPAQLFSFIKRTFRQIKVRELAANLKIDLENPADTGLLFAFIAPANLLMNYLLPYPVKIEPSFTGESFITGQLYGSMRLLPIQLTVCLIGLTFSLPTFRAVKKLVLYRWKIKG